MSTFLPPLEPVRLSPDDARLVGEVARRLLVAAGAGERVAIRVGDEPGPLPLPSPAARVVAEVLGRIARGEAIAIVPVDSELNSQQAADFLGIPRPDLVALLDGGAIPSRKDGAHRRVALGDLFAYRNEAAPPA